MNEKNPSKIVTNPTGKNGEVLCPVCMHGSTWMEKGGNRYTSPMRRFKIPGKVDALMHECCISKILQQARVKK